MSFAEAERAIRYNGTQNLSEIQSTGQEIFEASGQASRAAASRLMQNERVSKAAEAARKLYLSSRQEISEDSGSAFQAASLRLMKRNKKALRELMREIQLTGQEISEDTCQEISGDAGQASKVSVGDKEMAPGDPIYVLWENGLWYPAICISINQRRVEYEWLDPAGYEQTGCTDTGKVRHRIVGSFEIPVGARIFVKWKEDNNWFPAKFLGKRENNIHFEWEHPGEYEATGIVESSHVRLMVDEAQNVKLNPMLLPGENAVRRFTKDISTSCSNDSQASSSSRWFIEKAVGNPDAVLQLFELNRSSADSLVKGKPVFCKNTWLQTQTPHSHPTGPSQETHLYFKKLKKEKKEKSKMNFEIGNVESVSPKIMELDGVLYALVLISGLSTSVQESLACCVHQRLEIGFQDILPTQRALQIKLVQTIHKLCGFWSFSGNYLDSLDATVTFGHDIPLLQDMVEIFTKQPIDLQKAASRLTVFLAFISSKADGQIQDCQDLNKIMSSAAVYAIRCCREEFLSLSLNLVRRLDKITTRLVSDGVLRAEDIKQIYLVNDLGIDRDKDMDSLEKIASIWVEFSAKKAKPPQKIIALLQQTLENKKMSGQLNDNEKGFLTDLLVKVQLLWSCVDMFCKYFRECSFPGHYLYSETFSQQEKILACRHAVLIERAILKCISRCSLHIALRKALSNLLCSHKDCLGYMQVVYAEVYNIVVAETSVKLVVTASNIHKWFPFLGTRGFVECLASEDGETTHGCLGLDKVLCLHLGDSHEMGLIPSDIKSTKPRQIGNVNQSCLRCMHKLKRSADDFVAKQSARNNLGFLLHENHISISQPKHLVVWACMRTPITFRRRSADINCSEVNFAFGVNNEKLWQNLDCFQDVFCSEHSKLCHTPESLWNLSEPCPRNLLQLDQVQAALDIFSNFSGLNIDNRLILFKNSRSKQAVKVSSERDILLTKYGELLSHLNQDALDTIYTQIQELNSRGLPGLEGVSNETYADQNQVDQIDDMGLSDMVSGELHNTPDAQLKDSPTAAKFSKKKKRKHSHSARFSRTLNFETNQTTTLCMQPTMSRDEYYHACRLYGVVRQVQITDIQGSDQNEFDCSFLSIAAVLPNPNPDIDMPLFVLIAQIPTKDRTSLFSSCDCVQCRTCRSQTQSITMVFFHRIVTVQLRPICMCIDVMQHVLKQFIDTIQHSINPFCGDIWNSDEILKLDTCFCVFHSESKTLHNYQCDTKLISKLQVVSLSKAKSKSKTYFSVLVQKRGSQEVTHGLVYISSVQKAGLKELCKKRGQPDTQLYCMLCDSFLVTRTGRNCPHVKAANIILNPPPPPNGLGANSADEEHQTMSDLEDVDNDCESSSSDDQEALDCSPKDTPHNQSDGVNTESIENDNHSHKKQAQTDKEYFDPDLANSGSTGYVMIKVLSSKQGAKAIFDITYGNSPQIIRFLEIQQSWTLIEFLTKDKTSFDLCSAELFQEAFIPEDKCVNCSFERSTDPNPEAMRMLAATVYLANGQICTIPAKSYRCSNCCETNYYDGRRDGLWFYSPEIAFSIVLLFRQLKGFVRGTTAKFSAFVNNHDDLVKSFMNNISVRFVTEKMWRIVFFSYFSTLSDFRFPCSLCLWGAVGSKPADFTRESLDQFKRSAPRHVWDSPGIIQDAIADFVESRERHDDGAGTIKAYPVEQYSCILDRCPLPTGGFTTHKSGKHVFKNALNATSEQRKIADELRELWKSVGKRIEKCVEIVSFRIPEIDQMKLSLRYAWHAKQKEGKGDHPLSLLLDMLHEQKFPSVWPHEKKVRCMHICGIFCQQIGAQASILTLIKDWVVAKILKFYSCIFEAYCKLDTIADYEQMHAGMPILDLQTLRAIRCELIQSLAPNPDSIPADPNIYLLVQYTSADDDEFLDHREVNLAVSSALNYLAYSACELSSRHGIMIAGCEDTGVFNLATDTQHYKPVLPLRSYLSRDDIMIDDADPEISEQEKASLAGYNPVRDNCALYFTPEAGQLRPVPFVGVVRSDKQDGDCTKTSYRDGATIGQRNSTDMLSVLQCVFHPGCVVGYTIIFKGEGRKDSYYPVAAYKQRPPALFVYDYACGSCAFCSSRHVS